MSEHLLERIRPVLDRQHQLIATSQVVDIGIQRTHLQRLERRRLLERVHHGVYRRAGSEASWHQRVLAALLAAGHPAQASHRAAARLLGRPTFEAAAPEITVPSKRRIELPGIIVHESRDIGRVPPVRIDGIPCTPPRRLAVDIGAVLGPTAYATVLRDLRRDHGITWEQLAGALRLHSRRGRDGCGPLRRQLERTFDVDGIPETTLEQMVLDLLIDAWLPLPVCQLVVPLPGGGEYRLDFAYPRVRLAIEVDGPHHRRPGAQARDARRDRILRSLGWTVVRFDEEAVTYHPEQVLLAIRQLLAEHGVDVTPVPPKMPDLRRGPADRSRVP